MPMLKVEFFFDSLGLSTVYVFKVLKKKFFFKKCRKFYFFIEQSLCHSVAQPLFFFCFPNEDDINLRMQII